MEYLAKNILTIAEQVHLYTILVATNDDAIEARARIINGRVFLPLRVKYQWIVKPNPKVVN
ncbi:MAG: hypothetical protein PHY28_09935 [Dehalococcoidales bacterium]|nr:hypothetical protein [Dehalococcoidales bacterium]